MSNQIIAEASIDINEAPRQAENAQKTADKAVDLADANATGIKNINDPNYLSPFEKPQLEIQMDNFAQFTRRIRIPPKPKVLTLWHMTQLIMRTWLI